MSITRLLGFLHAVLNADVLPLVLSYFETNIWQNPLSRNITRIGGVHHIEISCKNWAEFVTKLKEEYDVRILHFWCFAQKARYQLIVHSQEVWFNIKLAHSDIAKARKFLIDQKCFLPRLDIDY